jgi:hypothetical protein
MRSQLSTRAASDRVASLTASLSSDLAQSGSSGAGARCGVGSTDMSESDKQKEQTSGIADIGTSCKSGKLKFDCPEKNAELLPKGRGRSDYCEFYIGRTERK